MNGVHDLGGQHGHGAVVPEADEPLFHGAWERRALGVTLAMGGTGQWTIDMARAARERIGAARYLASSYYEIWLAGLERLMLERGLVGQDELDAGHALRAPKPVGRVLRAPDVAAVLARGSPTTRAPASPARFAPGDRVRTRNHQPAGHTRLPGYVRRQVGTVVLVHGAHVFADRHARWQEGVAFDDAPEWLYTVAFRGEDLWGEHGEAGVEVSVDAWEPYLEPA